MGACFVGLLVSLGVALFGHRGDQARAVVSSNAAVTVSGSTSSRDHECENTRACKDQGRCSLRDPACVAELSERCAQGANCRSYGCCAFRDGLCRVTQDADCARSENCGVLGKCALVGEYCRPTTDEHCARSGVCVTAGRCGVVEHYCVPTKDEHCRNSWDCDNDGLCSRLLVDGEPTCVMAEHYDCASTWGCKEKGLCGLGPLRGQGAECVAAKLVERKRWPLTEARHGLEGTLVLAQDRKMLRKIDRSTRGYCPSDEDVRASSALQVRDRSGEVVSTATLYPDVGVEVEDIGSGTDTFRATEHVGCSDGHWSGWNTVLLEVRGGQVSRLRALGPGNEEREIAMTASDGERWKFAGTAERRELVVQLEGSAPEPALIETHFWFGEGRWRFEERRSESYDPEIPKQPGPWNGALTFHGAEWPAPEKSK
jgi:hypothetical protein